jgi:5-(carboxyamino)imidazole ribonucleotide mutase
MKTNGSQKSSVQKKSPTGKKSTKTPVVAVVMGSQSDAAVMKAASEALSLFGIPHVTRVVSAHRTPKEMASFAESARESGFRVVIAGAGGAAHLPGMIAAHTEIPVIGVPVPQGVMQGEDALWSIVQMPKGVPVATVAIGGAFNAGLLAAQILGVADPALADRMKRFKESQRSKVIRG